MNDVEGWNMDICIHRQGKGWGWWGESELQYKLGLVRWDILYRVIAKLSEPIFMLLNHSYPGALISTSSSMWTLRKTVRSFHKSDRHHEQSAIKLIYSRTAARKSNSFPVTPEFFFFFNIMLIMRLTLLFWIQCNIHIWWIDYSGIE